MDELDDSGASGRRVLRYVAVAIIWSALVALGVGVWLSNAAATSGCGSLGSACTAYAMSRATAATIGGGAIWIAGLLGLAVVNWTEPWRLR